MKDNFITFEKRKRDMKKLWKDTFHDSDRYIDLVFDTYFSFENSFVRYDENRLIAALLCVRYEFQILTREGKKEQLRGMYLCGLATLPDWRRRGIMAELMAEAEEAARDRGIDIAFLIPADNHLREYYTRKGYQTASWREFETIEFVEDESEGELELMHIYSVKDFIRKGKSEFIGLLADWCREKELSRHHDTIIHSRKDFLTIMVENENSIFLTECTFDPEYPILAKVVAVAFPELSDADLQPLRVVGLYVRESSDAKSHDMSEGMANLNAMMHAIGKKISQKYNVRALQILKPVISLNHERRGVEPYAMIKPLSAKANHLKTENPTIEISLMLD